ncbi:unnamed protein product [Candidula unifasciata]|uniref:Uncharacterized protein n=1 Tax=Candidula unifasciata TaxID=100452 RepID=A0A8S4A6X3_9EUPU|nr:unnamed protein product [Candidula unifasciata]
MCTVYKLTVLSFVLGAMSVGLFSLAVSTDSWLLTREALSIDPELLGNATIGLIWIRVWTGLWRLCMVSEEVPDIISCMAISYEVKGTGRGELLSTTSFTIIASARRSVALTLSSLILSVVAVIFSVTGNIRKDSKTLIGGVLFILSGLSLATGMILYISAINDEVGYRASTHKRSGGFSYQYGWSFFTAGFGFLSSEVAAVVTISLFLRRNAKLEDMTRIIPGLEDKVISRGQQNGTYFGGSSNDRYQFCHSQTNSSSCFHLCGGQHHVFVSA